MLQKNSAGINIERFICRRCYYYENVKMSVSQQTQV